ncbi:putative peptide chain release factor-like protein [Cercospora beticola]|uniref:Putative peptide chain release factor-like protein n=1 Tax=Cercospora beticola TaxID=122368 RepID=A0A2G5I2B4_CERBT|nr:putative peptide chain release factor-like protein [Cercospora beticola]PIA98652.1 putative peptide chain release factor-like protein [Cercospora beticola]WPB00513.1 hypothetical protein RHO25_005133 [Cercospora beticola]CAK1361268.1 unnamed protein product [Cercospora beticola]
MFRSPPCIRNALLKPTFTCCIRTLSTSSALLEKPLPPRIVIPEKDIIETFLKGSGPGGQKINKTSSAVQLKHLPTGIVVKNQETRSRDQNRKNARRILGERLEEIEKGPLARTALKAEKIRKKKASATKKSRRKYRQLEEQAAGAASPESGKEERYEDTSKAHAADVGAEQTKQSQPTVSTDGSNG